MRATLKRLLRREPNTGKSGFAAQQEAAVAQKPRPDIGGVLVAVEPVRSAVEWKNEIGLPVPAAPTSAPTIEKKGIEPLFKRRI
ncbi:MAG: hypothetical protein WB542_10010 [Polaromonas sp.]